MSFTLSISTHTPAYITGGYNVSIQIRIEVRCFRIPNSHHSRCFNSLTHRIETDRANSPGEQHQFALAVRSSHNERCCPFNKSSMMNILADHHSTSFVTQECVVTIYGNGERLETLNTLLRAEQECATVTVAFGNHEKEERKRSHLLN